MKVTKLDLFVTEMICNLMGQPGIKDASRIPGTNTIKVTMLGGEKFTLSALPLNGAASKPL